MLVNTQFLPIQQAVSTFENTIFKILFFVSTFLDWYNYQDYKNNGIDAVIELEDGEWCAFEVRLGAKKIDEGAEKLIKVCNDIIRNGGKAPKVKCVICGLSNAAYMRPDGVFVIPITALKN